MAIPPGLLQQTLGSAYELGPLIGRGGMAEVYQATDRRLRREVAVKVLLPELGALPGHRARFAREAQTAAGLSHPNIVPVFDVGEHGQLVWFTMGLIEGESLRSRVEREGRQPLGLIRRVLQETAQALAYAHARGTVHRDVTPGNILIDRASGRVMVADFGIAKVSGEDDETRITQPGSYVGTPRYMAPEQLLAPNTVDARTDQYALGLVVYYLLAGKDLIPGRALSEIIAVHVRGVAVDFAILQRRIPASYVSLLNRCLARDPAARYDRMERLVEEARELGSALPETPPLVRAFLRNAIPARSEARRPLGGGLVAPNITDRFLRLLDDSTCLAAAHRALSTGPLGGAFLSRSHPAASALLHSTLPPS